MQANPDDMKGEMEKWMAWAKRCGKALVDFGTPLGNGEKITKSGSTESKSNVVGYSILQAESMEAARGLLKGHPHLDMPGGCEIEVHESMEMPM